MVQSFDEIQQSHQICPLRSMVHGGGHSEALFSERDAEVLVPMLRTMAESLERDSIKVEVSRRA